MTNLEINRKLAEAMGYTEFEQELDIDRDGNETILLYAGQTETTMYAFNPTVDIHDAWKVAEKYYVQITPQIGAPEDMKYLAEVPNKDITKDNTRVFASTAPLAISLAVLKVIERSKSDE